MEEGRADGLHIRGTRKRGVKGDSKSLEHPVGGLELADVEPGALEVKPFLRGKILFGTC